MCAERLSPDSQMPPGGKERSTPEKFRGRELTATLLVVDLEESLAWYRDVIGFYVAERLEDEPLRGARLKAGNVLLTLLERPAGVEPPAAEPAEPDAAAPPEAMEPPDAVEPTDRDGDGDGEGDREGEELTFEIITIQDVDALADRIRSRGGTLERGPEVGPKGRRMIQLRDPDGFRFNITMVDPDEA